MAHHHRRFSRPVHSTTLPPTQKSGGDTRIRTGDGSFAGSCLTTWLYRRHIKNIKKELLNACGANGRNRTGTDKKVREILSLLCLPIPPHSHTTSENEWSGRRGSNPRPQPWQGCALPLSYSRILLHSSRWLRMQDSNLRPSD